MNDIRKLNPKEREDYFYNKYKGKVRFAGAKHGAIKRVGYIINNSKPNPQNLFVAEGLWATEKAEAYKLYVDTFIFSPEIIYTPEAEKMVEYFVEKAENSYIVSEKVFNKISERDGPDGLIALCSLPEYTYKDIELKENNLVIILDGIEIPGNIGTMIRTVDGAGGDGILVCNRRARLTHPKVIKGSHGSIFTIPVIEDELNSTIAWLKKNDFKIYLTDTSAEKEYYEPDYKGRVAIVAGSERYGISKEWYEDNPDLVSIPMYGDADSLNVAVSTAIFMYEVSLKQKGKLNNNRI